MPRSRTWRYWARIVVGTLIGSALVVVLLGDVTLRTPPRKMLESLAVSLVFGLSIAPLMGIGIPRVAPWLWRRLPSPLQWIARVLTMIVFAAAGSVIAILFLTAIGYVPLSRFGAMFVGSIRISIVGTLTLGLFITMYEQMQATAERMAAEAQLASLESRVHPHFLFNTLNSIAALIPDDPKGAERMTTQLASLMRSSLDRQSTGLVPLADELRIVRDYLEIERVRLGGRLRYDLRVDGSAGAAGVPSLIVQTLVENSVKYAVSPRREGATVAVHASTNGAVVRIRVEDDGPGFDAGHAMPGHGLALVRERLALAFADRGSMRVDGTPGATVVELTVPASCA
jgi:signal transduction histidine kinase